MTLRGYRVRQLAREIPCDPSTLSKMLRGLRPPTPVMMTRIDAILEASGTISSADVPHIQCTRPGIPRSRLTATDAAAIHTALAAFRAVDNRVGGGHSHHLAAAYLNSTVGPMLRYGTYTEADGRLLFAAAAPVSHQAAWTAYDSVGSRHAERYFARALELAAAAGDPAFTGEVLAARSHRAIHLGHPGRAIELARAARHAAAGTGVRGVLAEAWELEANGHALLGDRTACARALAACDTEYEQSTAAVPPPWLAYLDDAYIAARKAHTLRDLGDWPAAREHADLAATMNGTMVRARVFNTLIYATAWVNDDRDVAIASGRIALAMTTGIQSGRATAYSRDLWRRLRRRYGAADPYVARFEEETIQLLLGG